MALKQIWRLLVILGRQDLSIEVLHYTRKEIILDGISTTAIKEKRRSLFFVLSRMEAFLGIHLKLSFNRMVEKKLGFSFTLLNDRNSIISFLRRIKPDNLIC